MICTVENQRKNADCHLLRLEDWDQERRIMLANSHSLTHGTVDKKKRENSQHGNELKKILEGKGTGLNKNVLILGREFSVTELFVRPLFKLRTILSDTLRKLSHELVHGSRIGLRQRTRRWKS